MMRAEYDLAELAPLTADLSLGRVKPHKVMHHATCRHARRPYTLARQYSVEAFAELLIETGAWRWHHACQACCGDLDDALRELGVVLP